MFNIDFRKLHSLESAFVLYEIASHGADPRETLEGTTLRIVEREGYKQRIYDETHKRIKSGGPYVDVVKDALSNNLVDYHQKLRITNLFESDNNGSLEVALSSLYEGEDDEASFNSIVDAFGRNFDVIGVLYFIKDAEKYLPIRSGNFDERFRILGADAGLAGNCTWEKYQEYNETIKAIRDDLNKNVNKDITLLDAHSFVWILTGIAEYVDSVQQPVEHKTLGKGVIVDSDDETITVKFANSKSPTTLLRSIAIDEGKLTFIDPKFDIDGSKEIENNSELKSMLASYEALERKKYFIIHSSNSKEEYLKGFLSAPYYNKIGRTVPYWDSLSNLKPGDVLFHYRNPYIRAISIVDSSCYDVDIADLDDESEEWGETRRRVDYTPFELDVPVKLSDYTNDIIKYKRDVNSAFNKNGGIVEGYVHELEPEIASLFEKALEIDMAYGFAVEEKPLSDKAIEVAEALLKLIANRTRVITYGELSEMTQSKPSPYYEMRLLLDAINKRCDKLDLPYISAMVVNKSTDLPGEGFRELCIDYFNYNPDLTTEEIFQSELDKIGRCNEWFKLADYIGIEMPVEDEEPLPEEVEIGIDEPIVEGAKKAITVNSYERDPKAKRICKDYYMRRDGRITCQICGFDCGEVYGHEYANKIHIHHIIPVSEIGEEYIVDPIKDLIPVCPNCHMILHAGKGISVEDLKKKINNND